MDPAFVNLLQLIAYIGMTIGLVGTVVPILPGPILIWLSALVWAWADGFERVGWPTLVVMGLLALAAMTSNLLLSVMGARQGGASWRGLIVASLGAIAGFLIFNFIGGLVGAVLGLWGWEAYKRGGDWRNSWRASRGIILGYLLSAVLQFTLAVLMLALFAWQAFYMG